jgi:hypothetical protein
VIIIVGLLSVGMFPAGAEELVVEQATISVDIADREPVDPGNSFPASVDRLYCFTKVAGAMSPTDVTHVWYFGDVERARISLAVAGSPWRTYSSKRLQPNEVGPWHVDILDGIGNTMETVSFSITP